MMTAEALPGFPGARPIPLDTRNHNLIVYVCNGSSYVDNRENLVVAITRLKSAVYEQNSRVTRTFVEREIVSLEDLRRTEDPRIQAIERRATAMLVVERSDPYEFVAALTARELAVDASLAYEGYMDVLLTTRVVKAGFRDEGVGTFLAYEGVSRHGEAQMRGIRTQSSVPVWSDIEAGFFRENSLFPFARGYDKDSIAQQVMFNLDWRIKRRNNNERPHPVRGVLRGEYGTTLIKFSPKPDHEPTNRLQVQMEGTDFDNGDLGMILDEGDAVIALDYAENYRPAA